MANLTSARSNPSSNLSSARQAIQAELQHAKQGAEFYQSRVAALEEALEKLDTVDAETPAPPRARAGARTGAAKGGGRRMQNARGGSQLPSTGGDFWPDLITEQPQSAPEILNAAVKALGITPSKGDLKKLSQRQANALNALVKAHKIEDSGAGRARRYFRPRH